MTKRAKLNKHPTSLLAKQPPNTLQNAIFLGVVRVIFAGDFEDGGEGVGECVHAVTNALSDLKTRVSIGVLG